MVSVTSDCISVPWGCRETRDNASLYAQEYLITVTTMERSVGPQSAFDASESCVLPRNRNSSKAHQSRYSEHARLDQTYLTNLILSALFPPLTPLTF